MAFPKKKKNDINTYPTKSGKERVEEIDSYRDKEGYDFSLYEKEETFVVRRESSVFGTAKIMNEYDKNSYSQNDMVEVLKEMSGNYQHTHGQPKPKPTLTSLLLENDGDEEKLLINDELLEMITNTISVDKDLNEGLKIKADEIGPLLKAILGNTNNQTPDNISALVVALNNYYKEQNINIEIEDPEVASSVSLNEDEGSKII